jgi:hypothetical protein
VLFDDTGVLEVVSSPDGQRFLIVKKVSDVSPVSILLNWKPPEG